MRSNKLRDDSHMKTSKRKRLQAAGWKVASAKDFLGLTPLSQRSRRRPQAGPPLEAKASGGLHRPFGRRLLETQRLTSAASDNAIWRQTVSGLKRHNCGVSAGAEDAIGCQIRTLLV